MKKTLFLTLVAAFAFSFVNAAFADNPAPAVPTVPQAAEPVFNADVPEDGSVEDYLAFVNRIQSQGNLLAKPRPTNQTEFNNRVVTILKASIEAADKILAKDSINDGQAADAIKIKAHAFRQLARFDSRYQKEFAALAKYCRENGLDELAEELEVFNFVDDFMEAIQSRKIDNAKAVLNAMIEKGEKEGKKISLHLAEGLEFLLQFAQEIYDDNQTAEIYKKVINLFKNADNEEIVRTGVMMEGTLRRAQLPGNEMLVGGTFIDDTEYNAEDYKGKTVLIDFWATWCGPCRGEIPNVKKLYAYYHEKGFEIIGISSDRDVETLKAFIEREGMTWKQMMRDKALVANGQTMGAYYGVTGIPTMILIGPDGKVITVNARGRALESALTAIYGPMQAEEAVEADDADEEDEAEDEDVE